MPLFYVNHQGLTIVDVHGDFEAKTHVVVSRCFPFHCHTLQKVYCNVLA